MTNTGPAKWISKWRGHGTLKRNVGRQENFLNSRRSRMARTVIFWPWWQPFNSFCFETLSFFPFFPYFIFATKKKCVCVWGGWHVPPAPPVSPALKHSLPFTLGASSHKACMISYQPSACVSNNQNNQLLHGTSLDSNDTYINIINIYKAYFLQKL